MVRAVTSDPYIVRVRAICAALPDVAEVEAWGHPTFRVGGAKGKIFCGYGGDASGHRIGFKVRDELRGGLLADSRFSVAPYVGRFGWLDYDLDAGRPDWKQVAALVAMSHELIAGGAGRRTAAGKSRAGRRRR
jgi:predicted DNA-binding protein (MmcQ/YjbR family)